MRMRENLIGLGLVLMTMGAAAQSGTVPLYSGSTYSGSSNITEQNGNVGMGTTTPSVLLEVNGNVKLTAGSGASLTFADGTVQSTAYTGGMCSDSSSSGTATALSLSPAPTTCTLPQVATGISANGNAICSEPSNVAGTAVAATALAAAPTTCVLPQVAVGIAANGNAVCSVPSNTTGTAAVATALGSTSYCSTGYYATGISTTGVPTCVALPVSSSGFSSGGTSLASGFWVKDPTGHIHEWGAVNTDLNGGRVSVTFPTPFTSAASVSVVPVTNSTTDRITYLVNGSITTKGFTVGNNGSGGYVHWMADGY